MFTDLFTAELASHLQLFGTVCQAGTAVIAATIGVITYRYTRRQSALSLINQNNGLANLVIPPSSNQKRRGLRSEDCRITLSAVPMMRFCSCT